MRLHERAEHLRRPLMAYLRQSLRTQEDAEDHFQELWLRAYRWSDSVGKTEMEQRTWLYHTARNLVIDTLRSGYVAKRVHPDETHEHSDYPWSEVDARLTFEIAMRRVPASYRPALQMEVLDMTGREGAELLGVSIPAYKSALYRGKARLAEVLG